MIARVIVDRSSTQLDRPFDYSIPEDMIVEKGDRVVVPFGKSTLNGFVIDVVEKSDYETKDVLQVVGDYKCFSEETLKLMEYMRKRFFLKYVDILRLFIPSALRKGKVKDLERFFISINENADIQLKSQKQIKVVEYLKEEGEKPLSELNFLFGAYPVNALVEKGILDKHLKKIDRVPLKSISGNRKKIDLTEDQKKALKIIFETRSYRNWLEN